MLNAKELRVGNYVYDRGNKILRIDWFDEHKVNMRMFVNNINVHPLTEGFEHCQPIPLTEEWLLKFGFEEWHEHYFVLHNVIDGTSNFEVTLENGKAYPSIDDTCIYWRKNCYVHDLQNLLFALTGYELEI